MDKFREARSREQSREQYDPPRASGGDSYVPVANRFSRGHSPSPLEQRRDRSRSPLRYHRDSWRRSGRPTSPPARRASTRDDAAQSRGDGYRSRDYNNGTERSSAMPRSPLSSRPGAGRRPISPSRISNRHQSSSTRGGYFTDRNNRPRSRSPALRGVRPEYRPEVRKQRSPSVERRDRKSTRSPCSDSRRSSPIDRSRRLEENQSGRYSRSVVKEPQSYTIRGRDTEQPPQIQRSGSLRREPREAFNSAAREQQYEVGNDLPVQEQGGASARDSYLTTGVSTHYRQARGSSPHAFVRGALRPPLGSQHSPSLTKPVMTAQHLRGDGSFRGANSFRGRGSRGGYVPSRRSTEVWEASPMSRGKSSRGGLHGHDSEAKGPPTGPRAGVSHSEVSLARQTPGGRVRNNTDAPSATLPHTQRINIPVLPSVTKDVLSDMVIVKEGTGEKLAPLYDHSKADKLEEEAGRLRKVVGEREIAKRAGLRDWERLQRESISAALRSELAEDHLRALNGEGGGGISAF